jgi:hypothetical protein
LYNGIVPQDVLNVVLDNDWKWAKTCSTLCINKLVKPFTHGEFLKKTFADCAEALFNDFKNKKNILNRIK